MVPPSLKSAHGGRGLSCVLWRAGAVEDELRIRIKRVIVEK
jgi:hypothetical protein